MEKYLIKKTRWSILICFIVASSTVLGNVQTIDSLLHVYDYEISCTSQYIDLRRAYIDSIKQENASMSIESHITIGKLYIPYQCDSAIHYLTKATLGNDIMLANEATLYLIYLLASIGYYNESFIMADALENISDEHKALYYTTMSHLYGESAVYGKIKQINDTHFQIANAYGDSLLTTLENLGHPQHEITRYGWKECWWYELKKLQIIQARDEQNYHQALAINDTILSQLCDNQHTYAIFAYEKAVTYEAMQDSIQHLIWLIRSAIADVRSGVCDNGSAWMLANIMFQRGELERAMRYINYSLQNADIFNARLRHLQINPLSNIINNSHQQRLEQVSIRLKYSIIALFTLLLFIILLFIYTVYQNRRLHHFNKQQKEHNTQLSQLNTQLIHLNQSLHESNHVKEQYICRYLEVYSEYIQRITKMARKAGIHDPEGFMKQEMQQFYTHFDNTFITIYHNFVKEFNSLLKTEYRIYPKQGELLTTELRIFALIRLGIDSSAKIAKLLCYSPNTIYNYRAQMRNAALGDRDTFEERVKRLHLHE